jgi:pimeloyl-ACP methyl ester carboxylesterase
MRRGYVDTPLGQVHYRTEGEGDPLLLLGSSGRSSRMFIELIGLLSSQFRVVAIDYLGSGESDPLPPDLGIPDLGHNLVDCLDGLGVEKANVFGLHTGNKVGSALAARWPKRVSTFILCGQTHSIIPSLEERNHGLGERAKIQPGELDEERSLLVAWSTLSQRISDLWWQTSYLRTNGPRAAVERAQQMAIDELEAFRDIPALYRMNFSYDMVEDWRQISIPTLVLEVTTPREDALYGRHGPIVRDLIPGAALATLDADGYKLTLEDRASDLAALITSFCESAHREGDG